MKGPVSLVGVMTAWDVTQRLFVGDTAWDLISKDCVAQHAHEKKEKSSGVKGCTTGAAAAHASQMVYARLVETKVSHLLVVSRLLSLPLLKNSKREAPGGTALTAHCRVNGSWESQRPEVVKKAMYVPADSAAGLANEAVSWVVAAEYEMNWLASAAPVALPFASSHA